MKNNAVLLFASLCLLSAVQAQEDAGLFCASEAIAVFTEVSSNDVLPPHLGRVFE
jgi:hypothetical protein